jgi:phosphomannomutase
LNKIFGDLMSTLMVSISGIRGIVGAGLDPEVIVKYANAYADFVEKGKVVLVRMNNRRNGKQILPELYWLRVRCN